MDLATLWAVSPWLAVLSLLGAVVKQLITNNKLRSSYNVSLSTISYIAMSFEQKRSQAEQDYLRDSMNDAEEYIEEYVTEMVCDYRDHIKPVIYSESYKCFLETPCEIPQGHNLEVLYLEVYEKKLREGFAKAKPEIMRLIKNNGLTSRSHDDFDGYFTRRTYAIFETVVAYLKKEYDESLMPVSLRSRLSRVDKEEVVRLGLKVFKRAREHRERYEDRMNTIEREEMIKMEDLKNGAIKEA